MLGDRSLEAGFCIIAICCCCCCCSVVCCEIAKALLNRCASASKFPCWDWRYAANVGNSAECAESVV